MQINNFDEKINYLLAEIDRLGKRVKTLESIEQLVIESELTENSTNAVENGVVFSNIEKKADCDGANLSSENIASLNSLLGVDNKAEMSDLTAHTQSILNPHSVTKSQVGLGNVSNTADSAKSVLSASKLTTPRTIAGVSFDGSANIAIPFNNLSAKQTTLNGYGITDGAKTDASNLTSVNKTSWKDALNSTEITNIWTGTLTLGNSLSLNFSNYNFLIIEGTTSSGYAVSGFLFFDYLTNINEYASQISWYYQGVLFAELLVNASKTSIRYPTGNGITIKKIYGVKIN